MDMRTRNIETSMRRRKNYFLLLHCWLQGDIFLSKAEKVLKKIEKVTEKKFLPIIGPDKGKSWWTLSVSASQDVSWRWVLSLVIRRF